MIVATACAKKIKSGVDVRKLLSPYSHLLSATSVPHITFGYGHFVALGLKPSPPPLVESKTGTKMKP